MIMILFFSIFNFPFSFNIKIYPPHEIINYLEKEIVPQQDLNTIKEGLSNLLSDFYAFYEIAKNPPQPSFDSNYHNKVDLKKEINNIQTQNRSLYNFYQDILKILTKTRDGHFFFNLGISEFLDNFQYKCPVKFNLKINNEKEVKI